MSTHVSLTIRELREQFLSCINLCEQDVYLLASFGAFLRVEGVSVDVYIKNEEWKITGKESKSTAKDFLSKLTNLEFVIIKLS